MLSDWVKKSRARIQKEEEPLRVPSPVPFRSEEDPEEAAAADNLSNQEAAPSTERRKREPDRKKLTPPPSAPMTTSAQVVSPEEEPPAPPEAEPKRFLARKTLAFRRRRMLPMRLGEGITMPAEDPRVFEEVQPLPPDTRVLGVSQPPPLERLMQDGIGQEGSESEASETEWETGIEIEKVDAQKEIVEISAPPALERPAVPNAPQAPITPDVSREAPADSSPPTQQQAPAYSNEIDPVEAERQRRAKERARRTRRPQKSKKAKIALPELNLRERRTNSLRRRAEKRSQKRQREQEKMARMLQAAKEEATGIVREEDSGKSRRFAFSFLSKKDSPQSEKVATVPLPSLDIGSSVLRLYDPYSDSYYQRAIPDGIIVHGLLHEPEELAEEVKALWHETGLGKKMRFSVKNRLLQVRAIHLPAGSEEEIESALEVNAAAIVSPMQPEQTTVDYYQMTRSGSEVPLLVVAADKRMVSAYNEALKDAGLSPESCSAGPLVSQQGLVIPRSVQGTHALIDIGAETTSFLVASGPDAYFLRVLDIGGNDFTRALLGESRGWGLAEQEKAQGGLRSRKPDIQRALRPVADRLAQELLNTKKLFESSPLGQSRPLQGGTIVGGGAQLPGLAEEIQYLLSLPSWTPPQPRYEGLQPELFSASRGMANESRISLLPGSGQSLFSRGKKKRRSSWLDPLLGALLVSALLSFLLAWLSIGKSDENAVLEGEVQLLEQVSDSAESSAWQKLIPWVKDNPKAQIMVSGGQITLDAEVTGTAEGESLEQSLLETGLSVNNSRTRRDIARGTWVWQANVEANQ